MDQTTVAMRWARPDDAERIAEYHHACRLLAFEPLVPTEVFERMVPKTERWKEWLADGSEYTTVVVVDDDDVPFGHVTISGAYLAHLFIDPPRHRSGFGQALLAVGERLIRQAGHRHAELQTRVGNIPAIALYESRGWVMTDEIRIDEDDVGVRAEEHVLRKDFDADSHVVANRANWDEDAPNWVDRGRASWQAEAHWGEMAIPESDVQVLPELEGRDVIELGCGTGYVSSWCLAAGAARAVGLDNSIQQLRSAQVLQQEFNRPFPLVWSNAEQLPFADDSFDVAINEYGAAHWCDPYRWIPEAARVLRPGGSLMFLAWSSMMSLVAPDFELQRTSRQLLRPQRDAYAIRFPDFDGVQFGVSHGTWIEVLTTNGFVVDRLVELYAPAEGSGPERYSYYDAEWARQWPPEEIWCATLR